MNHYQPNQGKQLVVEVDGQKYMRLPIKTHLIEPCDTLEAILDMYVQKDIKHGDIVFIAESVVACMQQRLIKVSDVTPRKIAVFLAKFVSQNPHDKQDQGLALPETMEMVMREVGVLRILVATAAAALGKLLNVKGWFYRIAGPVARDIDGPTPYAIAPYQDTIILRPHHPQAVAEQMKKHMHHDALVVDINDLGGNVLGNTSTLPDQLVIQILADNPLGQSDEQTPLGLIRSV